MLSINYKEIIFSVKCSDYILLNYKGSLFCENNLGTVIVSNLYCTKIKAISKSLIMRIHKERQSQKIVNKTIKTNALHTQSYLMENSIKRLLGSIKFCLVLKLYTLEGKYFM